MVRKIIVIGIFYILFINVAMTCTFMKHDSTVAKLKYSIKYPNNTVVVRIGSGYNSTILCGVDGLWHGNDCHLC